MKKLLTIGEALIDFIPENNGCQVKDVEGFIPKVGGAPANVAGAYTAFGGESAVITQLGNDPFGDKIVEEMQRYHIGTDYVARTNKANTALAFVSLMKDGAREFSFYRKPSADMLFEKEQISKDWFGDVFGLHFCSVSLGNFPMKEAHKEAIRLTHEAGGIVSFDPNLRFALWEDENDLKKAVDEFLPLADVVKISDEELEFITGRQNIQDALNVLWQGQVKLVIYTCGKDGAYAFTKKCSAKAEGMAVDAVDTTGAGDGFIGSFLFSMAKDGVETGKIENLTKEQLKAYLDRSNKFCAASVRYKGAISSYIKAVDDKLLK